MSVHAKVLAIMLALQPPGASPYSLTVVEQDTPPPCDVPFSPLCAPPRWDKHHQAWVIVEPEDVGRKRYETIAQAVVWETWRAPPSRRAAIRRYLITAFYHESGFRADVHSGIGPAARGDCKWTGGRINKGKRIAGTCRSVCLGQMLFDPPSRTHTINGVKYRQRDLVGTDLESTRRCARVSTELIERAWRRCGGDHPFCVFGTYGGARMPTKHPLIRARVGTYNKLRGSDL